MFSKLKKIPRHTWVGLSNWAGRLVGIALQLVSIPILAQNLTTEHYAAYTIALSMLGWFALADLGMGASLQNFMAEAAVTKESIAGKVGAIATISVAVLLGGILLVAAGAPFLGPLLFKGSAFASGLATQIFAVTGTLFLLAALGTMSNRMLYGFGMGVIANSLTVLSSIASFLLLLLAIHLFKGGELLIASLVAYGAPLAIVGMTAGIILVKRYGTRQPDIVRQAVPVVKKRAQNFFLIAIFATGVLNVDYLVMSQSLDARSITAYNILSRYFGLAITLYGGLLSATSVHWAQLMKRKEWREFRASWRNHVVVSCGGFAIVFFMISFAATPLLHLLAPKLNSFSIQGSTLLLFGIYILVRLWTDTSTAALQAVNETRILLRWIPVQSVISVTCQIFFASIFGLNGIIIGLIVSFLATVAWALPKRLEMITAS